MKYNTVLILCFTEKPKCRLTTTTTQSIIVSLPHTERHTEKLNSLTLAVLAVAAHSSHLAVAHLTALAIQAAGQKDSKSVNAESESLHEARWKTPNEDWKGA